MFNKYYPAIIWPIERIAHEFYISFVIITWYVGTVIGSSMAIHLHTINRRKSELVLLTTGISFLLCILIETQLTIDSSHYDYFLLRIVLGTLIGVIYLTSIIVCLQSSCRSSGRGSAYYSSTSICGYITIATILLLSQTEISIELCCVSLTLIYSLIALNLSHTSWAFGDVAEQRHQQQQEFRMAAIAAETITITDVRPSNVRACNAFDLVVGKQTRPLIYLAGAKLLTIFCFFLPFICIASRITIQANISFTDDDYENKRNGNDTASADEADVNIDGGDGGNYGSGTDSSIDNHGIFTDLMVLLLTRIALGSIAILLVRHNVNYSSSSSSFVYMIPITIGLSIMLIIPLFNLTWHPITVKTITFSVIMIIYVAFSLIVDIVGHHAALYANDETIGHLHATATASIVPKVISLTFATFIEHLIDICIVVIYLNDWISAKLIATSFAIIFLTMIFSQKSTNSSERQQNSNLITVKYQIL